MPAKLNLIFEPEAVLSNVKFVIVLSAPLIVLFVSVCVSLVPTTVPDGIAFCEAEPSKFPEPFDVSRLMINCGGVFY